MGITYTRTPRWKYRTEAEYEVQTPIRMDSSFTAVGNDYVLLYTNGLLYVAEHYAWDGPSGPAIDTRNWMRASLVHDALYQLLRDGAIAQHLRLAADDLMYTHLREDGMSRVRAKIAYRVVRLFGAKHAARRPPPKVLTAP